MLLICILGILLILYVFDNVMCCLYATHKKSQSIQSENKDNNVSFGIESGEATHSNLTYKLANLIAGWIRYRIIRVGRFPSHWYRKSIMVHIFKMDIGRNAVLHYGFEIRDPWKIKIGNNSIIGDRSILDGRNGIIIGENVQLSTGVWIWTEQHNHEDPLFRTVGKGGAVHIGSRAWVSSRTTILPNVNIGEGTVIAAGAVVTKSTDCYAIYGGVPAKKIGDRTQSLKYKFDGTSLGFY